MAIIKRAVASAANEKPANGVVKINSIEEPKAKQKVEAAAAKKETPAKQTAAKKTEAAAKKPATAEKKAVPAKKAPAKKAAAKKTETKKPAVKAVENKKSVTAKPIEKKTAAKKATVKKTAAKTPVKKAATKTTAPAKSAALKTELTVQYSGRDIRKEEIDKAFEGVWTYDMGRKMSEVKKVDYYFKPEESAVYFVVNDGTEGRFEI